MYIDRLFHSLTQTQNKMAITTFTPLTNEAWAQMQNDYTNLSPVIAGSGTTDPYLNVRLYVNKSANTQFVIALSSTGLESLALTLDTRTADQLDLQCTSSLSSQAMIYYSFTETQGWTDNFNVTLDITNTNSSKGTWTFTKGKNERPHF